jgi:LysM repeat protein
VPIRDHRCWAVQPPSVLPMATQQELCLSDTHAGCERFLRSREQRLSALAGDQIEIERLESARFGPFISPMPVAVDPRPAPGESGGGSRTTRRRIPGLIVAGGVVLVGIVALAAILGGGRLPGIAVASATPVPGVASAPAVSPVVPPRPTAVATSTAAATVPMTPAQTTQPTPTAPAPTATAAGPSAGEPTATRPGATAPTATTPALTEAPTTRPRPTSRPTPSVPIARRYTVKQGDTVKSIANKFGLKPRDIRAVNDIGSDVVPGQRLLIPAGPVPTPAVDTGTPP